MTVKNGQSADKDNQSENQKIRVGERDYTVEDVKSLLDNSASVTQKAQQIQVILDTAKSYGIEPEEFVQHAEGAFSVITNLKDQGYINSDGEIVFSKNEDSQEKSKDPDGIIPGTTPSKTGPKPKGADNAIIDALSQIGQRLQALEGSVIETRDTQTLMARLTQQDKIKAVYPNLQDTDISKIFAETAKLRSQGKKTSIMEVAKLVNEDAASKQSAVEKAFAEKHGLNYEQLKNKKLTTPKSMAELDEAGLMAITGQKKISLFPKGKGEITPAQALRGFNIGGK